MSDMLAAIAPKSDQINADDLIGGPMKIKIAGVKITPGEQPVSIIIEGERRVYRPCKSMMRVMVAAWGADSSAYRGQSLTLYREESVTWAGVAVGGIRISAMSGISGPLTLALSLNRKTRKQFTIQPLRGGGSQINIEATTMPEFSAPDPVADEFNALLKNAQIPQDKRKAAEEYAGSDPAKIRHAVKRLNAILDEVTAAQLDAEGRSDE